jgi:hypothetical protein
MAGFAAANGAKERVELLGAGKETTLWLAKKGKQKWSGPKREY